MRPALRLASRLLCPPVLLFLLFSDPLNCYPCFLCSHPDFRIQYCIISICTSYSCRFVYILFYITLSTNRVVADSFAVTHM